MAFGRSDGCRSCKGAAYRARIRGKIGGGIAKRSPPVDNGAMKLLEYKAVGGQIAFFDRSVVVAFERLPQDIVRLALQRVQFLERIGFAHQRNRGQQLFPVQRILPPFVPLDVVAKPGAARAEQRKEAAPHPDVIAVFIQECAFGAIDVSRGSRVGGKCGILVVSGFSIFAAPGTSLASEAERQIAAG